MSDCDISSMAVERRRRRAENKENEKKKRNRTLSKRDFEGFECLRLELLTTKAQTIVEHKRNLRK